MISLKQLTQLAATSTEVWQVFQLDSARVSPTAAVEGMDAKERAEQQFLRSRSMLWDLTGRIKIILDDQTTNAAIKARMLVDAARKLEVLDAKIFPAREDKNRHAQLTRDYQVSFDSLRLALGEEGMLMLTETFHYPERIFALGEFVKLRREKAGLDSRGMGIEKKIEEAQEELNEAEKDHACVEALLSTRKAQKGALMALGVVLLGVVLLNVTQLVAAIVGVVGVILLMLGLFSWLSCGVVFAAFDEELKRKVSGFEEEGFLAVAQRLRKARENMKALEVRMTDNRKELKTITDKLDKAAELERTWRPMTDLDVDNLTQKMTERCKHFFGDAGARTIFQHKRELSLL